MAQVVEPSLRQARVLEQPMELVSNYRSVQAVPIHRREHKVRHDPAVASGGSLPPLPCSMVHECLCNRRWQCDHAPATFRFWLDELQDVIDSLQLLRDP